MDLRTDPRAVVAANARDGAKGYLIAIPGTPENIVGNIGVRLLSITGFFLTSFLAGYYLPVILYWLQACLLLWMSDLLG